MTERPELSGNPGPLDAALQRAEDAMSSFGPVDGDWSKWTKPGGTVEATYAKPEDFPKGFGGTCYWCYWGWPKQIADIYDRAVADLEAIGGDSGDMDYGPAHVVWEDENWHCADECIPDCDNPPPRLSHMRPDVLAIVKRSLVELSALPESMKTEPEGYDGDNPENFPPTMEMVKR